MLSNKINEMYGDPRYYLTKLNDDKLDDYGCRRIGKLNQLKEEKGYNKISMIQNIKCLKIIY